MTMNRRSAGGPARRVSEPGSWARPPGLALLALALVGLVQAGCQSSGCNGCGLGGFGSRFSNGVQTLGARVSDSTSRLFHHKSGGCSTCGDGGVEGGMIVEGGVPMAPGAMVVPGPATVVPAPSLESAPTQLEPIEGAGSASKPVAPSGGGGASTRSTPGVKGSAYEAAVPRGKTARSRANSVARAVLPAVEPARAGSNEADDLLDNLPPVDVPSEVTRKAVSLTVPPLAPEPAPAPAAPAQPPAPAATPAAEPAKAVTPSSAEPVSAAEGSAPAVSLRKTPGIARTASVAPSVAGGSLPSVDGLAWLKEKGYRTYLDLRSMSEVDPNFVESVNDHGMVYLSLPIVAERLDASRLARFDDLIARSENRPLYFADLDGTRAGLVWYIHLRKVEGVDAQSASQRAESLGLTEAQVRIADSFLAGPKAANEPAPAAAQVTPEAAPFEPVRLAEIQPASALPSPSSVAPVSASAKPPEPGSKPVAPMLPGENRPQASRQRNLDRYREPFAWKPVAALVLTGIGVPLAYWSKSALSDFRSTRRKMASLPGAARRSLGAPAGSDA